MIIKGKIDYLKGANIMLGFFIGLFVGGIIGVVVMCLLSVAGHSDDDK